MRSMWKRLIGVGRSAGMSDGKSRSPRTSAVPTWRWYGQERDERCLGSCLDGEVSCIGKWWRSCRVGLENKVGHHDYRTHHLPHPPPPHQ